MVFTSFILCNFASERWDKGHLLLEVWVALL